MTPDHGNAVFELGGSILIWLNTRRLLKDRAVRGVSIPVVAFYAAWGVWNLYYYAALGQWLSWVAGLGIVAGNTTWCLLAWRWRHR